MTDLQMKYEQMMELYEELKNEIRWNDKNLYERWKAGGFLVDPDIMSMYPHMGKCIDSLPGDDVTDVDEPQ